MYDETKLTNLFAITEKYNTNGLSNITGGGGGGGDGSYSITSICAHRARYILHHKMCALKITLSRFKMVACLFYLTNKALLGNELL